MMYTYMYMVIIQVIHMSHINNMPSCLRLSFELTRCIMESLLMAYMYLLYKIVNIIRNIRVNIKFQHDENNIYSIKHCSKQEACSFNTTDYMASVINISYYH